MSLNRVDLFWIIKDLFESFYKVGQFEEFLWWKSIKLKVVLLLQIRLRFPSLIAYVGLETYSLRRLIGRLLSVLGLRLDRKPKSVICGIISSLKFVHFWRTEVTLSELIILI